MEPTLTSPAAQWAYRDVTFRAADTDTAIDHEFRGVNPEDIRCIPMEVNGAAYLYRAAGTRKANNANVVWMRASAACTARVLLLTEHP